MTAIQYDVSVPSFRSATTTTNDIPTDPFSSDFSLDFGGGPSPGSSPLMWAAGVRRDALEPVTYKLVRRWDVSVPWSSSAATRSDVLVGVSTRGTFLSNTLVPTAYLTTTTTTIPKSGFALLSHAITPGSPSGGTSSPINTTGAALLVCAVASYPGGGALVAPTDSASNTWTDLGFIATTDGNTYVDMFYCLSPTTSASHTFTDSNAFSAACVAAFSATGAVTYGSDVTATASSATIQAGSIMPGSASNLVISLTGVNANGAPAPTIDSGFTVTDGVGAVGGTTVGIALAYLAQAAATTVNPTWTYNEMVNSAAYNAVFTAGGVSVGNSPIMWSAADRYDISVPTIIFAVSKRDVLSPVSYSLTTRSDRLSPVEILAASRRDENSPFTTGASPGFTANILSPLAWSAAIRSDVITPIQTIAPVRRDLIQPAIWKTSTRFDLPVPDAWLAATRYDVISPLAFGGSVVSANYDITVPMAWSALTRRETLAPAAWSLSARYDVVAPTSTLITVRYDELIREFWSAPAVSDRVIPASWSAATRSDVVSFLETVLSVRLDYIDPIAYLTTARADESLPQSYAAATLSDRLIPLSPSAGVRADVPSPLTTAAATRSDTALRMTWQTSISFTINSPITYSVLTIIVGNALSPVGWEITISQDDSLPISWVSVQSAASAAPQREITGHGQIRLIIGDG